MRNWTIGVVLVVAACGAAGCRKDPQKQKLAFVASGDKYMSEAKYSEAVIQYRSAVALDGHFGEARFKLANAFLLAKDAPNAIGEFVRAADLMPHDVSVQIQAGKMLLMAGAYPEAKARAVTALEKDPKNVDALMLMGNALAGMKDFDNAITQIEHAIDADPRRVLSYDNLGAIEQARGHASGAESAFKRAVEANPKSEQAHLALANYYWASNQRDAAEHEFKSVLESNPKSIGANRALAVLYVKENKPGDAEPYLKAFADLSPDAGSKVVLADFYLEGRKPEKAAGVLDALMKTKDGFIPAKIRLAAIAFSENRHPEAYATLDEIFKVEPKNEQALLEKARFFLAERKAADVLPLTNTVVAGNPSSVPGHYLRGMALQATSQYDEAIKAYQRVLQLEPSAVPAQIQLGAVYLANNDPAPAVEYLDQAIKAQPNLWPAHFVLAQALVRLNKVVRAEPEVGLLLRATPNSPDVQMLVGQVYYLKHDYAHAREAYTRALQLAPGSAHPLAGLLTLDFAENKKDAARTRVQEQLKAKPDDPDVLTLAGVLFLQLNDGKSAEAAFRHLLEIDPSNLQAYSGLGNLYLDEGRLDEAKQDFEDLARKHPKTAVGAATMVGTILTMQGKPAEARKQFEQALALDPHAAVAANNLALNYAQDTDANLDVALQLAQTAKAGLPKSWEVDDTLGFIYYKKGLLPLAISTLQQGIGQHPTDATMHYHLGLAYLKSGKQIEARQSLQEALKLNPQFEAANDAKRVLATIKG
ncbi:MAG TPA: tetratricopeptide repeat protein [Vicinamibacterales bacterium]|nr:tetratricopeptide repeat protein [Vicinamibacterales bacterium]